MWRSAEGASGQIAVSRLDLGGPGVERVQTHTWVCLTFGQFVAGSGDIHYVATR
jgi:hypothetical protein